MRQFNKKSKYSFWHSPLVLILFFCILVLFSYNVIGLIQKERETNKNKISELNKIEELKKRQTNLSKEINKLKEEVTSLNNEICYRKKHEKGLQEINNTMTKIMYNSLDEVSRLRTYHKSQNYDKRRNKK